MIRYRFVQTGTYSGPAEAMIAEAERDALAWITNYDPQGIDWDGKRF
jgi:hypothetical protein